MQTKIDSSAPRGRAHEQESARAKLGGGELEDATGLQAGPSDATNKKKKPRRKTKVHLALKRSKDVARALLILFAEIPLSVKVAVGGVLAMFVGFALLEYSLYGAEESRATFGRLIPADKTMFFTSILSVILVLGLGLLAICLKDKLGETLTGAISALAGLVVMLGLAIVFYGVGYGTSGIPGPDGWVRVPRGVQTIQEHKERSGLCCAAIPFLAALLLIGEAVRSIARGKPAAATTQQGLPTDRRQGSNAMRENRDGPCQRCGSNCLAFGDKVGADAVGIASVETGKQLAFRCVHCSQVFCGRCCGVAVGSSPTCPNCGRAVEYAHPCHMEGLKPP